MTRRRLLAPLLACALAVASPALAGNSYGAAGDQHLDSTLNTTISGWPTFAFWFKVPGAAGLNENFRPTYFTGVRNFETRILYDPGSTRHRLYATYPGATATGTTNVDDGLWHHCAVIFNAGSGITIYLDGAVEAGPVGSMGVFNTPSQGIIGQRYGAGGTEFCLAHVGVWQNILNARDIQALAAGIPPHMIRWGAGVGNNIGLELYLPLNSEGAGNLQKRVDTGTSTFVAAGTPIACDDPLDLHVPRPHYSRIDRDRREARSPWTPSYAYRRDGYALLAA